MTIHGNVVAKLILREMATENEGLVGLEEQRISGLSALSGSNQSQESATSSGSDQAYCGDNFNGMVHTLCLRIKS